MKRLAAPATSRARPSVGSDAIQHEPDRLDDKLRLLSLNGVPAPRCHDVNPVPRATKPLVMHLAPRLMTTSGPVHVRHQRVHEHAREHGDRNVGKRQQSVRAASRLDAYRLARFLRLCTWLECLEHRVVIRAKRTGIRAVDESPATNLLLMRPVDEYESGDVPRMQ